MTQNPDKDLFLLDKKIHFLNHGSFGAMPKQVFQKYQYWQRKLENQPVEFLGRQSTRLLASAREKTADFLGTNSRNLVFIPNATTGMNIIARSLQLGQGDEILTTSHEYGAVDRVWKFLSAKFGFSVRFVDFPLPIDDKDSLVSHFLSSISIKTKAISISHISSPSSVIFPVREIVQRSKEKGIITIIDGAHAPGHISFNLSEINSDFYTGNFHKWLCAPKGSAFLFANPKMQQMLEPLIVSWGWESETPGESQFLDYFEWSGTRDISPFLAVPEAIDFYNQFLAGENQEKSHHLAVYTTKQISKFFPESPITTKPFQFFGQMASNFLPQDINIEKLKTQLLDEYQIEIPIMKWKNRPVIRVSYQIYNDIDDAEALLSALKALIPHA